MSEQTDDTLPPPERLARFGQTNLRGVTLKLKDGTVVVDGVRYPPGTTPPPAKKKPA